MYKNRQKQCYLSALISKVNITCKCYSQKRIYQTITYICNTCEVKNIFIEHLTNVDQIDLTMHIGTKTNAIHILFNNEVIPFRMTILTRAITDTIAAYFDKSRIFEFLKSPYLNAVKNTEIFNHYWIFDASYTNFVMSKILYNHTTFPTDIAEVISSYLY